MTAQTDTTTGSPPLQLFTRQATGLVRDVSPLSAVIFGILTAPFPWVLALAIFWTFGAYPGGNLYIAYGIAYFVGVMAAIGIGMLATTMPRSGGDYVLVGRTIHPIAGLISSFWFTANVLVSVAFIAESLISTAVSPSLIVIGTVGHHQTLLDWGTSLATNKGSMFVAGIVAIVICAGVAGTGWKWSLRFQNILFTLGMLGMGVALVVCLVGGGGSFVGHFNDFAQPYTHKTDSYHYLIQQAQANGLNVNPGTNFSHTIPVIGAVMGFSVYTWFTIHIAGEVQQARTWKFSIGMIVAALVNFLGMLIFTLLFVHAFGGQFFTAINGLSGTDAYNLPSAPFYVLLVSIAGNSEVIAWILGLSLVGIMMALLWLNLLQPVRALFAYAFDGVFPLKFAQVGRRTHIPLVALGVTIVCSIALYRWAVYGSTLFEFYATAIVLATCTMMLMGISAMILPWRRPEIWRGSVMNARVKGIPIITLGGAVTFIAAAFNLAVFVGYPDLGLTHPWKGLRNIVVLAIAAVIVYYVAARVRRSQGLSLAKTTGEIPPE